MTTLLSPVLMAESQALAKVLGRDDSSLEGRKDEHLATLLRAILPDVLATPLRMKRLHDALGAWLVRAPLSVRDFNESRQEFADVFEAQTAHVARTLTAARNLDFPPGDLTALQDALAELHRIRDLIFAHWVPLGPEDREEALREAREGPTYDLNEVINELRGRHH